MLRRWKTKKSCEYTDTPVVSTRTFIPYVLENLRDATRIVHLKVDSTILLPWYILKSYSQTAPPDEKQNFLQQKGRRRYCCWHCCTSTVVVPYVVTIFTLTSVQLASVRSYSYAQQQWSEQAVVTGVPSCASTLPPPCTYHTRPVLYGAKTRITTFHSRLLDLHRILCKYQSGDVVPTPLGTKSSYLKRVLDELCSITGEHQHNNQNRISSVNIGKLHGFWVRHRFWLLRYGLS